MSDVDGDCEGFKQINDDDDDDNDDMHWQSECAQLVGTTLAKSVHALLDVDVDDDHHDHLQYHHDHDKRHTI